MTTLSKTITYCMQEAFDVSTHPVPVSSDILFDLKASQSIIRSCAHLCDIVPHAPCLLVRMLRIFCFSWLAVT